MTATNFTSACLRERACVLVLVCVRACVYPIEVGTRSTVSGGEVQFQLFSFSLMLLSAAAAAAAVYLYHTVSF